MPTLEETVMALSQEEVTAKYARYRELTEDVKLYTPDEAIELEIELVGIGRSMGRHVLDKASDEYMKSIGREGELDEGFIAIDMCLSG